MRIIACVGACFLSLFVAACGDGGGGSGGSGGTGGSGTGGSATGGSATGGSATGGSGGTGGSVSTGGSATGGSATGGSGTGGSSSGAAFAEPCTMDTDCQDGLLCFEFNSKGKLCTKECQGPADCPPPSSGCNGMGYCKPD